MSHRAVIYLLVNPILRGGKLLKPFQIMSTPGSSLIIGNILYGTP